MKKTAPSEKVQQWTNEYQNYLDNPPPAGTILRAYGGEDARLDLELHDGKPPFLYGRAYVPCIVGNPLGWFLQPFDSSAAYGWKCILLPKAREDALRRLGVKSSRLKVKALKIVRYSATGAAILCEVEEYCPFEPTGETVAASATDGVALKQTAKAVVIPASEVEAPIDAEFEATAEVAASQEPF